MIRNFYYLLALLLITPSSTYANSWRCTQNNLVREVVIEYTGTDSIPCSVMYYKPTENLDSQLLWSAKNAKGYCETQAKTFIEKLSSLNWTCSTVANSHSSYQQSLKQYMEKSKQEKSPFSSNDITVMNNAAKTLASNMPSPGISVGEKAPDFVLNNAFGEKVRLRDKLDTGPVILVFYRGAWCPFCNLHLHALQNTLPEFKKLGAQLIAITPQVPDKSVEQLKKEGYPFQVLSDLDSKVMKDYKLLYELPDHLVEVYKKHGIDVEEYNGKGRKVLPVPGTFVIDANGIVQAVFADTDYKKRMEPSSIINILKQINY